MSVRADMRAAWRLLTVIPVPGAEGQQPLPYLPCVGVVFGGIGWAVVRLAGELGLQDGPGALLVGALVVAVWAVLSGGMHFDGVADTADGFGARGGPAGRLDAMRDSAVGALGVLAVSLTVIIQAAAVAALLSRSAYWPVAMAPVFSRYAATVVLSRYPAARQTGMGATVAGGLRPSHAVVAMVPVAALFALRPSVEHVVALGVSAIAVSLLAGSAVRRLGGVTGDVAGAIIVLAECVTLTVLALAL